MADIIHQVRWTGSTAVLTLPEHIDTSNADQIREQLLRVIDRGAAVLVADLGATISCDYSGGHALARAYQRAVARGTELRLVVGAETVRRMLRFSGLNRLVSMYPTLKDAVATGAERRAGQAGPRTPPVTEATPWAVGTWVAGADHAGRTGELLDWVVTSVFQVGTSMQAAMDLPPGPAAQRLTEALSGLDEIVREIRDHLFAERGQRTGPGLDATPPPNLKERSAMTRDHTALLRRRVAQTAHAISLAAADTAALLEQRAEFLEQPRRVDYPTEIKRWRVLADQTGHMAERWEQLQDQGTGVAGTSALTTAELRLLPLLVTHLSVPEIAAELYLSQNTIKSQVNSIYHKLGAVGRSQAVAQARQLGLLEN